MTSPPLAAVPEVATNGAPPDAASVELVRALLSPPTPSAPDDHPLTFGGDGTATFDAAGRTWTLRAPTLGEFRALVTKAETLRTRKARSAATEATSDLDNRAEWFRAVIVALGDGEAPKADALPLWCANPQLEFRLSAHWMRLPTPAPGN